ncbi:MAG: hypothetical protein M3Z36_08110 [Acidobacteriota bacterium]|nr:hypothetical protein [Acidobacteriota bacterium]
MRALIAAALLFVPAIFGADLTGIWTGQVASRTGEMQDVTFQLKQEGDLVKGKLYGDSEDTAISDVKISGDRISFSVAANFGGGPNKFLYTGTIKGNEIEISRERETRGPVDEAAKKQNPKQSFTLKRMT